MKTDHKPSPEEEEVAAFLAEEQQGDGEGKEEGEQPRPPALPIEESLAKLRAMRGIASCPYRRFHTLGNPIRISVVRDA